MATTAYTYRSLSARLYAAGIGDIELCRYEAGLLLAHFCGLRREELPLRRDEAFSSDALEEAAQKRCMHYPLQYLIGEWYFRNEVYEVSPDCLIPRADTELLVEEAIARLPENGRILDLCTGSGCIAISTLAARPDAAGVAVELYPETLALAGRNAVRNRVSDRLRLIEGDVLQPGFMAGLGEFDLILSNPPYIREGVIPTLAPEVRCEPYAALCGGRDGLDFYRVILRDYPQYLRTEGRMLLEIGYDQREAVLALAEENALSGRILTDLGGCDRVAVLMRRA